MDCKNKRVLFLYVGFFLITFFSCSKGKKTDQGSNHNPKGGLIPIPDSIYQEIPNAPIGAKVTSFQQSFFLQRPLHSFDQGELFACAPCAVAMAKSILDHTKLNIQFPNDRIIYSPAFLFSITHAGNNCTDGSLLVDNIEALTTKGVCKLSEYPYDGWDLHSCLNSPSNSIFDLASAHKIHHYYKISPISTELIKTYLYDGLPVIVGFNVDNHFKSFYSGDFLWNDWGSFELYHAGVIFGWNDSMNAFALLNSWGDDFGKSGMIWVDYKLVEEKYSILHGKVFKEAYIIQNPPLVASNLVADFNANITTINAGQTVTFNDQSTGAPTNWSWTLNGGNPSGSNSKNPTVTYNNGGDFTVSLAVSNTNGSDSKTKTKYIHVISSSSGSVPVVDFTAIGSTTIPVGSTVSFLDQSSNSPTSWEWYSMGATPTTYYSKNPTMTFNTVGIYTVSLVARNSAGAGVKAKNNYITVTSSTSGGWTCGQPFTDTRDGKAYATVNINGRCWMAENFKYTNGNTIGRNYEDNPSNYDTYGRMYSFSETQTPSFVPSGWHIPSEAELNTLQTYLTSTYGASNAGGALKAVSPLWHSPNTGATNTTGFKALPSGYYNAGYLNLGFDFYMWTSTTFLGSPRTMVLHNIDGEMGIGSSPATNYNAVRLIQN